MNPPPTKSNHRSLRLGAIALVFAVLHTGWTTPVAVGLGLAAIVFGLLGIATVFGNQRRAREAISPAAGGALGMVAILVCLVFAIDSALRPPEGLRRSFPRGDDRAGGRPEPVRERNIPAPFTPNLPIVILHTEGRYVSKENERIVRAEFFDVGPGRPFDRSKPDHAGWVSVRLRGTSSLRLPKPSYTLHTLDGQTNQTKVSLLGLPKEEDWVLYAPFEDKSLVRDVLAYDLARRTGHYAPRTRYVELFVDSPPGELSLRHYEGVYVLMEKIKRGSERVNIHKLEPEHATEPDISGGYIVKRDHRERDGRRFNTSRGGPYFYVYPNDERITPAQRTWLTRYFNTFEAALYGPDFADPRTGYAAYLDVDAFIDAHWLNELGKNVDGFRYSAFLTKDRGGKLQVGPAWDWNRSFGNANYYEGWETDGWYWSNLRPNEISWYLRLREDPAFVRRAAARWVELRRDAFDPNRIAASVDALVAELGDAPQRNFRRWPILGRHVTCNYYVGGTHADEVRWLKNWIVQRVAWIDRRVAASSAPKAEARGPGN